MNQWSFTGESLLVLKLLSKAFPLLMLRWHVNNYSFHRNLRTMSLLRSLCKLITQWNWMRWSLWSNWYDCLENLKMNDKKLFTAKNEKDYLNGILIFSKYFISFLLYGNRHFSKKFNYLHTRSFKVIIMY